ncbi:MAG: tyrosine-type recombinase/integrase [Bdellovibrionales bacterium]|nr:tyrosine-type recombinase/integrase [Bdellovibrionales bacterium]
MSSKTEVESLEVLSKGKSFTSIALFKVVSSYLEYYASGSIHTAKAKRTDIEHFLKFLTSYHAIPDVESLRVTHWDHSSVQNFIEHCLSQGEAPSTVSRRLATLKHMGRTLAERVPTFTNPAKEVKPPKLQALRPKSLTVEQVHDALQHAADRKSERNSFQRRRNEMLFVFLIETGLRADEVRLLRHGQLDEGLEWIQNVRTKGKKFRNVYISSALRPRLREYLDERRRELSRFFPDLTIGQDKKLPLFISTYRVVPDNPDSFLMGSKSIWRAINQLSGETKLHPHLLRHSFATDLLNSSQDVRLVAQALGHSDVRITMRYTERADRDIANALERKNLGSSKD